MTGRERILTAIGHRDTDKVPVDFGSSPSSGISAIAYNKLTKFLGSNNRPVRVYDVLQQLAEPEETLLDYFSIDVIDIGRAFTQNPGDWYDISLSDGFPAQYPVWFHPHRQTDGSWIVMDNSDHIIAHMPDGATSFTQEYFPLFEGFPSNYKKLPAIMKTTPRGACPTSPWDRVEKEDFWPRLRETCLNLKKHTDRALTIGAGCSLFEWGITLRRMDRFLTDLITRSKQVERFLDTLMETHMETLTKICHWVGDVIDIFRFTDDLGTQKGLFMRPETYRKLFKPKHTQLAQYIHNHSHMHTYLHSCGSIYPLIPDLIEAGFEILNPIQTSAKDMDPAKLKKEYGKDITLWGGGIENTYILNNGTPDEVRRMVLERLNIFTPGGGYIFSTNHNILPGAPPENILAIFNTIREFNGDELLQ